MIARGAGEGFNLMIPIRRMRTWAEENKVLWALDPSIKMPTVKEIENLPIEMSGLKSTESKKSSRELNFLIRVTPTLNEK